MFYYNSLSPCPCRMSMTVYYLAHYEQLSLETYEYIDCGANSTIPHSVQPPPPWWMGGGWMSGHIKEQIVRTNSVWGGCFFVAKCWIIIIWNQEDMNAHPGWWMKREDESEEWTVYLRKEYNSGGNPGKKWHWVDVDKRPTVRILWWKVEQEHHLRTWIRDARYYLFR